jgi:hypothetical protein
MANRRTRSAAIRRSFAQGIRGSAAMPCCLTNPRAQRQRGSIGCDAPHAAGCEACINGGCLSASCVFEMRCVAWRSKICTDGGRAGATTAALVRNGPSSSAAEAVTRCRLRDANSAAARLQHKVSSTKPATPDLARPSAIDGGGCNPRSHRSRGLNVPRQPRHAECCAILGMNSPA